jgi:hypothetical protein
MFSFGLAMGRTIFPAGRFWKLPYLLSFQMANYGTLNFNIWTAEHSVGAEGAFLWVQGIWFWAATLAP